MGLEGAPNFPCIHDTRVLTENPRLTRLSSGAYLVSFLLLAWVILCYPSLNSLFSAEIPLLLILISQLFLELVLAASVCLTPASGHLPGL